MKLIDTKANKPRMNLMHYIVDVAEQKNKTMLSFPSEMKYLNEASRSVLLSKGIFSLTSLWNVAKQKNTEYIWVSFPSVIVNGNEKNSPDTCFILKAVDTIGNYSK